MADAFENCDFLWVCTAPFLIRQYFMKIRHNVSSFDDAVFEGDQEVTSLGKGTVIGINDDPTTPDGFGIDLTGVRLERADKVEVSSRPHFRAFEQWLPGGRASAYNLRLLDTVAGGSWEDRQFLRCKSLSEFFATS